MLVGVLFIWAICVGAMNEMPLFKRIMSFGLGVVFLLYGLVGDKPADYLFGLLFGFPTPTNESDTDTQASAQSADRPN